MGALNMIGDICKKATDCKECPFVNDNMLTPDEKKAFDSKILSECYFDFAPDAWDIQRIIITADFAYRVKCFLS